MLTEPIIVHRAENSYMAISANVSMSEIPTKLPPMIKEVNDWLSRHQLTQAGPPFFRYLRMDPKGRLDVEVGVLTSNSQNGDGRVHPGRFTEGDYVTVTHTGPYSGLRAAHMALEEWANAQTEMWKKENVHKEMEWGSRTEFYLNDPEVETNPQNWQTEIIVKLRD